jgi:hypothetical protein
MSSEGLKMISKIMSISDGRKVPLTGRSTVVAARDQIFSDLAGEAIVLNLKSGVYYGLDSVGATVWQLVQQPVTVTCIRDALLQEYDVDPDRCEQELLAFFEHMLREGLVDITNEADS